MKKIIIAVLCIISMSAHAQIVDSIKKDLLTAPDTVKHLHSKFLSLVPPAALITYGGISFAIPALRRLDYSINNEILKTDPGFSSAKTENYFQFAPVILVYGLNFVGVSGKNTFLDRTILLGISGGFVSIMTSTLKHTTNRLRPNSADYLSFPSGHTSTAFAGAEFMAQEYSEKSPWYGVVGYTIATTTGIFRLYNHDHWFSDVVAGAGFGIISTKLAYLVYPYLRNALTRTDKKGKSSMLVPTYQDGMAGFTFAMQL
ncbi:MAG: phosphatase PAP2 family protein [Mucilaginibacter sp.]|uniref:phosphatase PAP2 family protein n=1 Tax=Mucilaginibacter sp. TaxID=1882438 RepID=UPI00326601C0